MRRVRAAMRLAAYRVAMRRWFAAMPLDALLAKLTRSPSGPSVVDIGVVARDARYVEALLERVPGVPGTCLYRSLARYGVLRRLGHEAVFVMGLPIGESAGADGHAWVEVDGAPFAEATDVSRFRVTFSYPPPKKDGRVGTR